MVIINADDFGYSPSVNEAIVRCFKERRIHRTTIMATMPNCSDAVAISKENGFFDRVGLHITLDEGKPLSEEMKGNTHFCKCGEFIEGNFAHGRRKFILNRQDRISVEAEIRAQMRWYLNQGFPLMHFDSHRYVHNNLSIIIPCIKLGKEMGFKSVRLMEIRRLDPFLETVYKKFLNGLLAHKFKTSDYFFKYKETGLPDCGEIELMVHPDIEGKSIVDIISWNPRKTTSFSNYRKVCELK